MELAFGLFGFFLVQLGFMGLFSLHVPPWMAFLTMVIALGSLGMAFSKSRYRHEAPWVMAGSLTILALLNLALVGPVWFSVGELLFAGVAGSMGLRMNAQQTWEDILHPSRLLHHRARHPRRALP